MKTEHKYAQVLRWLADGEAIECRTHESTTWGLWPGSFADRPVAFVIDGKDGFEFRLKPCTITVNGREVQAGEETAPVNDQTYWIPMLSSNTLITENKWDGDRFDKRALRRGLVHLTKEAAISHARAMLNIPESAENEIYE